MEVDYKVEPVWIGSPLQSALTQEPEGEAVGWVYPEDFQAFTDEDHTLDNMTVFDGEPERPECISLYRSPPVVETEVVAWEITSHWKADRGREPHDTVNLYSEPSQVQVQIESAKAHGIRTLTISPLTYTEADHE